MTLEEFKDMFAVGARFECTAHWQEKHVGKVRTVVKQQRNGYFYTVAGINDDRRLWSDFPKRSQLAFHEDGSFTFFPGESRTWTIRPVEVAHEVA